jgi:hypothetical protein
VFHRPFNSQTSKSALAEVAKVKEGAAAEAREKKRKARRERQKQRKKAARNGGAATAAAADGADVEAEEGDDKDDDKEDDFECDDDDEMNGDNSGGGDEKDDKDDEDDEDSDDDDDEALSDTSSTTPLVLGLNGQPLRPLKLIIMSATLRVDDFIRLVDVCLCHPAHFDWFNHSSRTWSDGWLLMYPVLCSEVLPVTPKRINHHNHDYRQQQGAVSGLALPHQRPKPAVSCHHSLQQKDGHRIQLSRRNFQ